MVFLTYFVGFERLQCLDILLVPGEDVHNGRHDEAHGGQEYDEAVQAAPRRHPIHHLLLFLQLEKGIYFLSILVKWYWKSHGFMDYIIMVK